MLQCQNLSKYSDEVSSMQVYNIADNYPAIGYWYLAHQASESFSD